MGSSSDKNCDARNNVPVDGFEPNCTICRRLTPVAGKLYATQPSALNAQSRSLPSITHALKCLIVCASSGPSFHDILTAV